jgi:glycosyltransferase EpsD
MQNITEKLLKDFSLPCPRNNVVLDVGTDLQKFNKTDNKIILKENKTKNAFTITFVGEFKEHSKRQDIIIRALPDILLKHRNIKIIFAGNGPTLNECKAMAKSRGVLEHIEFLGFVPHSRIPEILQESDIAVMATEFEGAPKSIIEAMAAGKPVVASDISPIREITKNGETALLAKNTQEDFAKKIALLLADEELRTLIGDNARRYAELNFDSRKCIHNFETLLDEIVKEK